MSTTPDDLLHFWFEETPPARWFGVDPAFDALLAARFGALLETARLSLLWAWRRSPQGRLAEIIVLDQFSRNIHRGSAAAFAADPLALALAQEAVAQGADQALTVTQRAFLYLPFMHSEALAVHDEALRLYAQPGLENNLAYEHKHRDILLRFGRYPHRNMTLGRESTPEEITFLQTPGSSF
ncbi:MAG: DUF924 domain-containing protein [Deltaproteobacteria bacterium]|nr:DUF924 domain-containing protein [Deltaproteobacteria bacterium]